jgi:CheY-like chemotaxis protein
VTAPFGVLLVEDDPAIVEIVRVGLSYEGADVTVAADGVEGLRLYRETAPDIVLLDIMLPDLDGLGVLRSIKARGDTPVILLTARGRLGGRGGRSARAHGRAFACAGADARAARQARSRPGRA